MEMKELNILSLLKSRFLLHYNKIKKIHNAYTKIGISATLSQCKNLCSKVWLLCRNLNIKWMAWLFHIQ